MKIITALNNPKINNKLKEKTNFEIICNDIQYQDGIIEMLEKNEKIDLIIISELLPGCFKFIEIVNKIKLENKSIEIIAILKENNEILKNQLISKGIFDIFINNEITIEELIKIIEEKNNIIKIIKENEINIEIEKLKEIILENKKIKKENKFLRIINKYLLIIKNKIIKKDITISKKTNNKIISVAGANGVGKSVFSSAITRLIKNKKILLIDFDVLNQSLNTVFGQKRISKIVNKERENNIFNLIIKINKNLDALFATDFLFNENLNINKNKIKNMLNNLKEKYDLIIIDTTSECFFDYTKEIFENSNLIIFLTESNLIELKKSKKILDIYINKWDIEKQKFNIIFNKQNINSIDNKILKVLFSDFKIIGKLKLNNSYNLLINNNLKIINKKIQKEFIKIINKLELGGEKND